MRHNAEERWGYLRVFGCNGCGMFGLPHGGAYDRAAAVARDFYTGVVDLVRSSSEDVHTYSMSEFFFLRTRSASQRPYERNSRAFRLKLMALRLLKVLASEVGTVVRLFGQGFVRSGVCLVRSLFGQGVVWSGGCAHLTYVYSLFLDGADNQAKMEEE